MSVDLQQHALHRSQFNFGAAILVEGGGNIGLDNTEADLVDLFRRHRLFGYYTFPTVEDHYKYASTKEYHYRVLTFAIVLIVVGLGLAANIYSHNYNFIFESRLVLLTGVNLFGGTIVYFKCIRESARLKELELEGNTRWDSGSNVSMLTSSNSPPNSRNEDSQGDSAVMDEDDEERFLNIAALRKKKRQAAAHGNTVFKLKNSIAQWCEIAGIIPILSYALYAFQIYATLAVCMREDWAQEDVHQGREWCLGSIYPFTVGVLSTAVIFTPMRSFIFVPIAIVMNALRFLGRLNTDLPGGAESDAELGVKIFAELSLCLCVVVGHIAFELVARHQFELSVKLKRYATAAENTKKNVQDMLESLLPSKSVRMIKAGIPVVDRSSGCAISCCRVSDFHHWWTSLMPTKAVEILNDLTYLFDRQLKPSVIDKVVSTGDSYIVSAGLRTTADYVSPQQAVTRLIVFAFWQLRQLRRLASLQVECSCDLKLQAGVSYGPCIGGLFGIRTLFYDASGPAVDDVLGLVLRTPPMKVSISTAAIEVCGANYQTTPIEEFPGVILKPFPPSMLRTTSTNISSPHSVVDPIAGCFLVDDDSVATTAPVSSVSEFKEAGRYDYLMKRRRELTLNSEIHKDENAVGVSLPHTDQRRTETDDCDEHLPGHCCSSLAFPSETVERDYEHFCLEQERSDAVFAHAITSGVTVMLFLVPVIGGATTPLHIAASLFVPFAIALRTVWRWGPLQTQCGMRPWWPTFLFVLLAYAGIYVQAGAARPSLVNNRVQYLGLLGNFNAYFYSTRLPHRAAALLVVLLTLGNIAMEAVLHLADIPLSEFAASVIFLSGASLVLFGFVMYWQEKARRRSFCVESRLKGLLIDLRSEIATQRAVLNMLVPDQMAVGLSQQARGFRGAYCLLLDDAVVAQFGVAPWALDDQDITGSQRVVAGLPSYEEIDAYYQEVESIVRAAIKDNCNEDSVDRIQSFGDTLLLAGPLTFRVDDGKRPSELPSRSRQEEAAFECAKALLRIANQLLRRSPRAVKTLVLAAGPALIAALGRLQPRLDLYGVVLRLVNGVQQGIPPNKQFLCMTESFLTLFEQWNAVDEFAELFSIGKAQRWAVRGAGRITVHPLTHVASLPTDNPLALDSAHALDGMPPSDGVMPSPTHSSSNSLSLSTFGGGLGSMGSRSRSFSGSLEGNLTPHSFPAAAPSTSTPIDMSNLPVLDDGS